MRIYRFHYLFLFSIILMCLAPVAFASDPPPLPPYVISIDPVEARPGDSVTFNGTGFGSTKGQVFFGSSQAITPENSASVTWTATKIVVPVPDSASIGNIKVWVVRSDTSKSNELDFKVLQPVTVKAIGPTGSTISVGDFIEVNITCDNLASLGAFALDVSFDPLILEATGVRRFGPFPAYYCPQPNLACLQFYLNPGMIDNASGKISGIGATINSLTGASTLAIVTFKVKKYGVSSVDVDSKTFTDIDGNSPHVVVVPGQVVVGSAPVAMIDLQSEGFESENILFDGSGSFSPNALALTYLWAFGDNSTSTLAKPLHKYLSFGTYNISLKVTDTAFEENTATASIRIFIAGDVNKDTTVDIFDLVFVARSFNAVEGDPSYCLCADPNKDGVINILDLVVIGKNFGRSES